jgi:DNA-binding MarR family transcriptional regulator
MVHDMTARAPGAEAWELLVELWQGQRPRVPEVAAAVGLRPAQAHLLRMLDVDEPVPMRRLACAMRCDPSNVTGLADRLEQRGLVERRTDSADRRVKALALTPAGAKLRDEFTARLLEPPPEIATLPASEQRALRDVLRRALGR